jgi:hypothetical protein
MTEEYVYQYKRYGFEFTVWRNRIEIRERGMLAWRTDTLLLRNVNDVGVRLGGKLQLTLSDGKTREYILGLKAEEARAAIVALL